jgi:hypothetical protein
LKILTFPRSNFPAAAAAGAIFLSLLAPTPPALFRRFSSKETKKKMEFEYD